MICPRCRTDMTSQGPDRLDQSGFTHLPAERWACPNPRCPEVVLIVATDEQWQPSETGEGGRIP